jgi:hypothetical protein
MNMETMLITYKTGEVRFQPLKFIVKRSITLRFECFKKEEQQKRNKNRTALFEAFLQSPTVGSF